jgi:hypothetical protein
MKVKQVNSSQEEMKKIGATIVSAIIIFTGVIVLLKLSKEMLSDLRDMGL